MSNRTFLSQFFKQKRMVGALAPSSKFLAAKMLNHLPIEKASIIVELGPGTGVFTDKIIKRMAPNAHLIVIELNDIFFENMSKNFTQPNVHLHHDSAEKMGDFIQTLGAQHADIIVSSLPFTVFPSEIRDAILNKIHEFLNPEGYFVQFQYSLHSKKALNQRFNKTKIKFTPLNIPPAFIYTCSKV